MDIISQIKQDLLITQLLPDLLHNNPIKCPLPGHDDRTPSFHHYPETNSFNCFGCRRGGSVIDLIMHLEILDFKAALQRASEFSGIPLREMSAEEIERQSLFHRREDVLERITQLCYRKLWEAAETEQVKEARAYLASRGWPEVLLQRQRIGFLDLAALKESGKISEENLKLAGMLNADGKPIFRDVRILYPIIHRNRAVYAVGGRFLQDFADQRKYVNLAAGPLGMGSKQFLYNMDATYHQDEVFICEGIPDCLTALALGVNAVGTLGAGNCDPRLFQRTRRALIIPDNDKDEQGCGAAIKLAMEIFKIQDGGDSYILKLPESEWRKSDLQRYREAQKQAQDKYEKSLPRPEDFGGAVAIKDLNDWYCLGYTGEDFQELIRKAEPIIGHYLKILALNVWNAQEVENQLDRFVYPLMATRGAIVQAHYKELLARPRKQGGLGIPKTVSSSKLKEIAASTHREKDRQDGTLPPAEVIHRLRSLKGAFTEYELTKKVTDIVLEDCLKRGKFYIDANSGLVYLFLENEKSLIEVSREKQDFCALISEYNVCCSDKMSVHLEEAFRQHALKEACKTPIHHFCFFDMDTDVLYLAAERGLMHKITEDKCDIVELGSDGILLLPEEGTSPVEIADDFTPGLYEEIILNPINFQRGALSPDEQRLIFDLFVLSMLFGSIMPTKPLLALVGEKGSRKSSTLRKVARLFSGPSENVHHLPSKEDDFIILISNRYFVALDNVDTRCEWLENLLAISATGGKHTRRKLYTDNIPLDFHFRAFIAISSREPHFRRDDVADRALILRLEKTENEDLRPESNVIQEVDSNRAKLWRGLVGRIQEMIKAIKAAKQTDQALFGSSFRMADFGSLMLKWGWHTGRLQQVRDILRKMTEEQVNFAVEDDLLYNLFMQFMQDVKNEGKAISGPALFQALKAVAETQEIDFPIKNARSFGKHFARLVPNLKQDFVVDSWQERHVKHYQFLRRERIKGKKVDDTNKGNDAEAPF